MMQGNFFDAFVADEEAGVDFGGAEVVAEGLVEFLRGAVVAAGEEVDEAGAVFWIGVDAGVALGEEIDDGEAVGLKDVLRSVEDRRSGEFHRIIHRRQHSSEIRHGFAVAADVTSEKVLARKIMRHILWLCQKRKRNEKREKKFHFRSERLLNC